MDSGRGRRDPLGPWPRSRWWCFWRSPGAPSRSTCSRTSPVRSSPSFDVAVQEFAESYAEQNERDHRYLLDAIASGRIEAEADA